MRQTGVDFGVIEFAESQSPSRPGQSRTAAASSALVLGHTIVTDSDRDSLASRTFDWRIGFAEFSVGPITSICLGYRVIQTFAGGRIGSAWALHHGYPRKLLRNVPG